MVTTNFEQIENDTYPEGNFYVYVFRYGEDIFYVGESVCAPSRIWEHFCKIRSNLYLSQIIDFVGKENILIDMYSGHDIAQYFGKEEVMKYADVFNRTYEETIDFFAKEERCDFESRLIYELSPLCNGMGKKSDPEKVKILRSKYYPEIIIMPLVRN